MPIQKSCAIPPAYCKQHVTNVCPHLGPEGKLRKTCNARVPGLRECTFGKHFLSTLASGPVRTRACHICFLVYHQALTAGLFCRCPAACGNSRRFSWNFRGVGWLSRRFLLEFPPKRQEFPPAAGRLQKTTCRRSLLAIYRRPPKFRAGKRSLAGTPPGFLELWLRSGPPRRWRPALSEGSRWQGGGCSRGLGDRLPSLCKPRKHL